MNIRRSGINTQELREGAGKLGVFTWQQATVVRVSVQADAIEVTTRIIQQATRTWADRNRSHGDERHTRQLDETTPEQERGENQREAPWGNIGSMGIRVDSEWWWVSEGAEATARLRDWMTVLENT